MANKLDDSSSEEQQQQQQCQNTGGATNEHLNIISDTTTTATTTKRQQTKSILAHGKLNDLVADLCAHNNTEFSNTRLKNGAPDVFIDNINNCAASYTTTSTSTTTTTAASSSSFSFKHFLSNSSRDMTAPSSTVTSLDPIIMSTTLNVNGESETPATTVVATTGVKTSTGARPKIPQSNSVSTTSICTLMSNTRISDGSAGSPEHLGVGVSVKMKRSPRFSSFDSQASLAEYAENKPSRRSNGHQHFATTQSTTDIDIMSKYVPRSYSNYDMPPNNSNTNSNKRRENDANFLPDSVFGCFLPTQSSASKETRPTLLPLDSLETVNVISAADSTQSGSEFASSASVAAAAAALPDFVQDHWLESWQIHDNNMRLNSPATSPVANEAAGFAGMGLTSNLRGRLAPAKLALAKNASGMKLGTSNFCGVIGDKRNRSNNNNNNAINPNTSSLNLNKQQQQQQLEDHIEVEIGNLDNNGGIDGNHQSNTVGGKMLPDFLADRPNLHSLQRLADVAAGLPSDSVRSPESENSTLEPLSILRQENARLQNELTESAQNLNDQRRRYIILELDYQELHQQYLLQQQQFQQLQQHQHQQQQQQQQAEQDIKKIQQLEQQQQQQSNVHENNNNNNNNNHHHHNDTNDSNKHLNAESEIVALRLHLSDLTVELEKIRSENAILREGGAVGGVPVSGVGHGATGTPTASASTTAGRTVRTQQQISRDLLFAASNAENNLRQLLAGVENLRQMANEIENNDWRPVRSGEISPDLYPEYFEDVDAIYDDFRNGPPL